MWKDSKRAKKKQKTKGQLRGKAAIGAATATKKGAVKEEKGEI